MISSDITFKDYYNKFIESCKTQLAKVNEQLDKLDIYIDQYYNFLFARKEEIRKTIGITLDNYVVEFVNKEYNPEKALFKKIKYAYTKKLNETNNKLIVGILNYCHALDRKHKYNNDKKLIEQKLNMSFTTYQEYVFNYYSKVHEMLLSGCAYKFSSKIGFMHIDRFPIKYSNVKIDIKETNRNRRKLLAEGKTPYNEALANWHKEHNIEYNGVKYKVNRFVSHTYKILITRDKRDYRNKIAFNSTNYINAKYRGSSYQEIADTYCKTVDDIMKLQVSIDIKLKLLLIKYPGYYINFVRSYDE